MNTLFIRELIINWNSIEKESYLRRIPALRSLEKLEFSKNVTFFCGENGTGKSTLLEAIAVAYGFNPEGGSRNYHFSTFDSHSELCESMQLVKGIKRAKWGYFLRAESFYNVASKAEDYRDGEKPEYYYAQYGGKSFHQQSHGESFMALLQGNFVVDGVYILDEPEAALSPQRQLSLLTEISKLASEGAQFIIATHSPILLGLPDAEILSFDHEAIHVCEYEDTESYQITEMFINNRDYLLRKMLSDEEV